MVDCCNEVSLIYQKIVEASKRFNNMVFHNKLNV